jgi:hypothetical protein
MNLDTFFIHCRSASANGQVCASKMALASNFTLGILNAIVEKFY